MKFPVATSLLALAAPATTARPVQRRAAIGDFDELNSLFENALISMPDEFTVNERVGIATLDLTITNMVCSGISVGDVQVSHARQSDQVILVDVDVLELDLTCTMDYSYDYGILSGDGSLQVNTDNNSASTKLSFASNDFDKEPPTTSSVEGCVADVQITNLDFQGDFVSEIIEVFQRLVRGVVERQVGDVACQELGSLGTTLVENILDLASDKLEPYLLPLGPEWTEPLYIEQNIDLPSTLVPLNLLDTEGNTLSKLFDQALNGMDLFLSSLAADDQGSDGLAINTLIRDYFLDDNHAMVLDAAQLPVDSTVFFEGHDRIFQTTMTLNQVKMLGLDTMKVFQPFVKIGNQTLQNELSWEELVVVLDVTVDIKPSSLDDAILKDPTSKGITERITVDFGLKGVDILASLLVLIDEELLGSIQMGSLLHIDEIIPCLMTAVNQVSFVGLDVQVEQIDEPTLHDFISPGMDRIISDSVVAAFSMYEGVLQDTLPKIFQTSVRSFLNDFDWMDKILGQWSSVACSTVEFALNDAMEPLVDFRDLFLPATESLQLGGAGNSPYGDLFRTARTYIHDNLFKIDEETGLSNVNDLLIDPLTLGQSESAGSMVFPGELLSSGTRLKVGALDANIELRVSDARINNLDTIGSPLQILRPFLDDPYLLNHTAAIGVTDDRPLQFAINLLFSFVGDDGIQVRNELEVSMDLSQVSVLLKTMMMVTESRFLEFPLRDILNFNCWLATMPAPKLDAQGIRLKGTDASASLEEISASVASLKVNITCVQCSSPRMLEFAELFSAPQAQDDVTDGVNSILEYVSGLAGGNFVQVQIDRMLNDAGRKCPHSPLFDETFVKASYEDLDTPENDFDISYLLMLTGVVVGLIVVVALAVFGIRVVVRRRHKKWLSRLPPHQIRALARQQDKERQFESSLNARTQSMFTSPEIPLFVRWGMPLVILGNIGFFLSGHLSLGATVNVEAEIAGEKFNVEKFFEFSMAKSALDIWNAGGKELSLLIFIFSGVWPYTKQLISLWLWFAPPTRVSSTRRGSILLWLDWLAKWSMVDVFVLVISIAAFRVSIQSPSNSPLLPSDFYSVDMMVVPLWGLYANLIAQLISQLSSHFIIAYHRRIVRAAQNTMSLGTDREQGNEPRVYVPGESPKGVSRVSMDQSLHSGDDVGDEARAHQALRKHQFSRPHRGETEKLVVRKGVNALLCIGVISLGVLVVIGCVVPSFSLEILGIVGVAVEIGQDFEDATTQHSIFTVLRLLMDEARFLDTAADFVGLGSLSLVTLVTVLFVPIVQSIALFRQWFFPATRAQRSRMAVFLEILQAWQYAEVYLLAVFVASWQLGPVSQYMINAYCENLQDFFAQAVYYGVLREEDAQCFSVHSSIESGFFYLAGGAVILALVNTFVTKAVVQYFRDKDTMEKQRYLSNHASDSGLTNTSRSDDGDDSENEAPDAGFSARIQPVPVLFTDTFRWLLHSDNSLPRSSRALFGSQEEDEHWNLPEARAIVYDEGIDAGIIQGQYVSDNAAKKGAKHSGGSPSSPRSKVRNSPPAAAGAARRLNFEDDISEMQGSIMDSVSSGSLDIPGWRSTSNSTRPTSRKGNLKDDLTYATPPGGEPRIRSQPPRDDPSVTSRSRAGSKSLPRSSSASRSVKSTSSASSKSSSKRTPREQFQEEELSLEEQRTVQEILAEEEFVDAGSRETRSEYAEETLDEEFEEYTVRTMSDILEEEDGVYEDLSHYTDERSRQSRHVV